MKLRELKDWINSKDDAELDSEIGVATHAYPSKYNILHPVMIGGYYSKDNFDGYLLICLTHRELDYLERIDKLKEELEL